MQKHFLEAFVRKCSIESAITRILMLLGPTFVHEGTKSKREESCHIVIKILNSFELLCNENANYIYSRLNIVVEEVNVLGLTQPT
jgi:hypothetical protein